MRTVTLATVLLLTSIVAPAADAAGASGVERIVIEDVNLIGRQDPSADFLVNVLIVGGKLEMVTRSDLVKRLDDIALNGSGGFLMGRMAIGEPPSFVIMDQDPREHFEVLLDTEAHVRFAMHEGAIVKNELPEAAPSPPGATERRVPAAYTPPPIAIPIRYYDSRKWNKFETKAISGLLIGAVLLDRQVLVEPGQRQRGAGRTTSRTSKVGQIRAARFGVAGTLNFKRPWRYTVFAMTHTFDQGFDSRHDGR